VVNNFSFNILSGYAAGLEGLEIGGLVNLELDYVKGVQIGGLTNVVLKKANGAQFGGILNYAGKESKVAQFGGIANIVTGYQKGAQFGGILNYNHGLKGFQAGGIANITIGNVHGSQVGGIANVANEINGLQLSGIVNIAKRVKGAQISLINIADTVDGVSIGFLTFVRKGYHKVDISANESIYANAAFKTGTNRFYNIFSVGFRPADSSIWSFGYGIGTELNSDGKMPVSLDLSTNSLHRIARFGNQLDMLHRLDVTFARKLSENATLFAGPSFNVFIFNYWDAGDAKPIDIAPYTLSDDSFKKTRIQTWVGLKAGVRLF
jgi:hypothetical protein